MEPTAQATDSAERTAQATESAEPASEQEPDVAGRHRLATVAKRVLIACAAIVAALVLAMSALLLVTPSVGNARQLASALDRAHGAPYPGVAVPHRFATALEATEDHRFAGEPGVDPVAIGRVIYGKLTGQGDEGGATLYQQLAKMLYTPDSTSFAAKAEQMALAIKLKYSYNGAEILRLYSDVTYFGQSFYGLQIASCGYFGVQPAALSWPQAALLAGLVQAPTADNPFKNPANAMAREQHVMARLVAVGALSRARANAYLAVPLRTLLEDAGACHA